MKERGVSPGDMKFSTTAVEKPYIARRSMLFSTSMDSNYSAGQLAIDLHATSQRINLLIAMGVAPGLHRPPAFSIGFDGMKLKAPRNVQVLRRGSVQQCALKFS
jgi:4'-phosphopantetheinyl transferase